MKVRELIEKLQHFDPEMLVVVDGYEAGFDEVEKLVQIAIVSNPNKQIEDYDVDWEGEFSESTIDDADEFALLLPRKS